MVGDGEWIQRRTRFEEAFLLRIRFPNNFPSPSNFLISTDHIKEIMAESFLVSRNQKIRRASSEFRAPLDPCWPIKIDFSAPATAAFMIP